MDYKLILAGLMLLSSIVLASAQEDQEVCLPVYNFIMDHYNGTDLNYLVYEFEDLRAETNLSIKDLKDYLINYEDKCYLILPFENYKLKSEDSPDANLKDKATYTIKTIFDDPKSFLAAISFVLIIIICVRMAKNER